MAEAENTLHDVQKPEHMHTTTEEEVPARVTLPI